MKVLITGGAGFIASHVADAYVAQGYDVHILDDFSSGRRENVSADVTVHEMSITDPAMAQLFEAHRFDVLNHHAAQLDVRRSVADPGFDATVNVLGFLNLMEAGRRCGLKKVIFASTGGALYGEPVFAPQDEDHPLRPISPYGITKLTTERYLYYYQQQHGISYVALRYANVYGPRQNPGGEAGVVSIFARMLLDGQPPTIYGDGMQTRDYVYVGDVVAANVAALGHGGSGAFNIGTGEETTVNQLFGAIRDVLEIDARPAYAPPRTGEQLRSVLGWSRAHRVLGWEPGVALEEGVAATMEWYRAFHASTHAGA